MKISIIASALASITPLVTVIPETDAQPKFTNIYTSLYPSNVNGVQIFINAKNFGTNIAFTNILVNVTNENNVSVINNSLTAFSKINDEYGVTVQLGPIYSDKSYYSFETKLILYPNKVVDSRQFIINGISSTIMVGNNSVIGRSYKYENGKYLKDEFYLQKNENNSNYFDASSINLVNVSEYFMPINMTYAYLYIDVVLPNFTYHSSLGSRFILKTKFLKTNTLTFELEYLYTLDSQNRLIETSRPNDGNSKLMLPDSLIGQKLICTLHILDYGPVHNQYMIKFNLNINKNILGKCNTSENCAIKSKDNNDYNFINNFTYKVGS